MSDLIKVSASSRPTAVAGAVAAVIRERERVEIQAIGAGAVNQAIKAVAIAGDYLQQDAIEIAMTPAFVNVRVNNDERTALRFTVFICRAG